MPTRLIREGILDSEAVDQLDYPAEVFYRRLMSKVDDFGLFDARVAILRSHLYPLRTDKVREADISRWMAACQKAGLIALYEAAGKPLGQMLNTQWQTRSEPKHPLPPWGKGMPPSATESTREQVKTLVPVVVVEDVAEDVDGGGKARKRTRSPNKVDLPEGFGVSDRVVRWASEKGHDRLGEHLEAFVRKCKANGYRYIDWDEAFMNAIADDWAKLKTSSRGGYAAKNDRTVGARTMFGEMSAMEVIDV